MNDHNETERLLGLVDNDLLKASECIERQLNVLYTRAQVLLSLAGMAVTVTGFSGRIIADTNTASQIFIIAGLAVIISSVVYIFNSVMTIKWVTCELAPDSAKESIDQLIDRRDSKTKAYTLGGRILCLGLILYSISVAIMLLNPTPLSIAAR